jgi:hypothetical protein
VTFSAIAAARHEADLETRRIDLLKEIKRAIDYHCPTLAATFTRDGFFREKEFSPTPRTRGIEIESEIRGLGTP